MYMFHMMQWVRTNVHCAILRDDLSPRLSVVNVVRLAQEINAREDMIATRYGVQPMIVQSIVLCFTDLLRFATHHDFVLRIFASSLALFFIRLNSLIRLFACLFVSQNFSLAHSIALMKMSQPSRSA